MDENPISFGSVSGLGPVTAGRFAGDGRRRDWQLIPRTMVFSCVVEGVSHEQTVSGEFLLAPGDLICFRRGQWHSVSEYGGRPLTTFWLNFEGDDEALRKLPGFFGIGEAEMWRTSRDPAALIAAFAEIVEWSGKVRREPDAYFFSRFFRLAELCCEVPGKTFRPEAEALTERAVRLCRLDSMGFPTVPELAEHLGVSRNTLLNACRKELGVSAAQLLLRLKLERARELLRATDYKLACIASACGFRSTSYFVACFRAAEKVTPSLWRAGVGEEDGEGKKRRLKR